MKDPSQTPNPYDNLQLYSNQELFDFAIQVERGCTQQTLDILLTNLIGFTPFTQWPKLLTNSLLHLSKEHQHPAAFLAALAHKLLQAIAAPLEATNG